MARAASYPVAGITSVPRQHWDGELAVDIMAPEGTPWLAVFDGMARPINVPLGGYALILSAQDGTEAYYAHGTPDRANGSVRAGQVIGYVSTSGNAEGGAPHLHFAVGSLNSNGGGTLAPWDWLAGLSGGSNLSNPIPVLIGDNPSIPGVLNLPWWVWVAGALLLLD